MFYNLIFLLLIAFSCNSKHKLKDTGFEISKTNESNNKSSIEDIEAKDSLNISNLDSISNLKILKTVNNNERNIDSLKILDSLNLYEKRLIGEIVLSENKWYIVSGRSCNNCDENISIYLFPENSQMVKSKKPIKVTDRFTHPGKVYHYTDKKLIYESSTFFGKCFDNFDNVIIWVERGINDETNEWEESLYFIQLYNNTTIESWIDVELVLLKEIDKHIAEGNCFEIEEINQISEP